MKKIDKLNNNMINNFQQLKIGDGSNVTINYNNGKYIGEVKNGMRDGK